MRAVRQEIGGLGNLMFKEAYIWAQMREGNIPDIYVQSPKYWEKYAQEIRSRFESGIKPIDRVALHIRRGDYLKVNQFHTNVWDIGYYQKAVKEFPNETFLVFCKDNQSPEQDRDDREWLERNIPLLGVPFELHEHTTEVEDLNAMAGCKGIIGANSSFSWWAAFLGDKSKKVVFPKDWFVDGVRRVDLLEQWKTI